ncbi:uncharacterized protein PG986_011261 [Apiospora aurea]|uniref:Uncharacterized protein n=1 Tax=Apiospora aurea TaxID=335848 RepID=A0ABR1Q4M5_9PEZI
MCYASPRHLNATNSNADDPSTAGTFGLDFGPRGDEAFERCCNPPEDQPPARLGPDPVPVPEGAELRRHELLLHGQPRVGAELDVVRPARRGAAHGRVPGRGAGAQLHG